MDACQAALDRFRKIVPAVMSALMQTRERDNLLLADQVGKIDENARLALTAPMISTTTQSDVVAALGDLLRCADDADGVLRFGLLDCRDNHGGYYQSADLEAVLKRAAAAYHAALSAPVVGGEELREPFQTRVHPWLVECFGSIGMEDREHRADRMAEEFMELLQAVGYPEERFQAVYRYVMGRPKGEPHQEVGGVMMTLAAFCIAHDMDMHEAGEAELARVSQPEVTAKIRAKEAAKPKGSALPGYALTPPPSSADCGAGWRDIATAPKDGTAVLIRRPTAFASEEGHHVVRWDDDWWQVHDGKFDHPLRGPDPTEWIALAASPITKGDRS